jgi:hypothetical protein
MFQTGNRANPGGARKSKQWAEAIRKAALRPIDPKDEATHLDALAQQLIAKGLQGDTAALKEIGDRIDGKAIQSIEAEVTATLSLLDALRTINAPGIPTQADIPAGQPE